MIVKAIINLLKTNTGITNLVADRIEPNIIKEEAKYPAIYVSSDRMQKLNCRVDAGIRSGVLEVGVYADTYKQTHDIIEAVRAVLDDYEGISAGVGISIMRGVDTGDKYDDQEKKHVKIIEYDAIAQLS